MTDRPHILLGTLMSLWRPGSRDDEDWTWQDEAADVWKRPRVHELVNDIVTNGIKHPIVLGHDGRVWDGHHRIVASMHLFGPASLVPIEFVTSKHVIRDAVHEFLDTEDGHEVDEHSIRGLEDHEDGGIGKPRRTFDCAKCGHQWPCPTERLREAVMTEPILDQIEKLESQL